MIITYHGQEHAKISLGDLTIAYNPVSKDSRKKITKYGANIALSSSNDPVYTGFDEVTHGSIKPFIIKGPGEYEINGIFIKGIGVLNGQDTNLKLNTIYTFTLDNMTVCLLGDLTRKLTASEREHMDDIDIVFACSPEDGSGLSPFEIYTECQKLSPKIIIPLGFNEKTLPLFLKEGNTSSEKIDKLTIKRKDIDSKTEEIILISEA